jgi:outer membrane protein OmpA-like peptidoglycan-associated protein
MPPCPRALPCDPGRRAAVLARPFAVWWVACAVLPAAAAAQESVAQIRPVTGLTFTTTLESPVGDRESLVLLKRVDSVGIHYVWRFVEVHGDSFRIADVHERRVRANDLAGAPRWDPVFGSSDDLERPGYTAFSISSAVYVALRDRGSARFTTALIDTASGSGIIGALTGGSAARRARYKGTLTRVEPEPAPFPLLLDGLRVTVPALQLRGELAQGARRTGIDIWVLADSAHPLVLKTIYQGQVLQVVRVDFPATASGPTPAAGGGLPMGSHLEGTLAAACRVELPGVYFAFNSALIDPASDRVLAQLAAALARHRDWTMTVEGHTDSIGTTAANQALSERRAEAVRARVAERHGVDTRAWKAVGYGASRPREPNATIEGRARNRRVELVRDCPERN